MLAPINIIKILLVLVTLFLSHPTHRVSGDTHNYDYSSRRILGNSYNHDSHHDNHYPYNHHSYNHHSYNHHHTYNHHSSRPTFEKFNHHSTLGNPYNKDPDCGSEKACQMGAKCVETPGIGKRCDCDTAFPGWGGPECSYLTCDVNKDFTVPDHLSKNIQHLDKDKDTNQCICPEGWTGVYCKMCMTDEACNNRFEDFLSTRNGSMRCDKSMITVNKQNSKVMNCVITSEFITTLVGDVITVGQCSGISLSNSTKDSSCLVAGFSKEGYPRHLIPPDQFEQIKSKFDDRASRSQSNSDLRESLLAEPVIPKGYQATMFYCYLRDCYQKIEADHKVEYRCERTHCSVTDHYPTGDVFPSILEAAETFGTWTCNNKTRVCTLYQKELAMTLDMDCNAGECVYGDIHYPEVPPRSFTTEIIIANVLGALAVFTILGNIIYFIYSKIEDARKMRLWEKENKNGAERFEFDGINYSIKLRDNGSLLRSKKQILHNVSGNVSRGSILAIMGASGAGKTTLLDILSARRKSGSVTGDLLINGLYATKDYKRQIGYVTQEIQLMGTMTVKECLMFSANLRLPTNMSRREKKQRVQQAMEDLGINHLANRYIGTALKRGISGGEKRRVNIACELVLSPTVLFLDEPTTGLDSYNALKVMQCLKQLANRGKIIVLSIHQPRSNIFTLFDELLLLSDGHVVYSGHASSAVPYFESLGYSCPKDTNPADFLLDLVIEASHKQRTNMKKPSHLRNKGENALSMLVNHYQSLNSIDEEDMVGNSEESHQHEIDMDSPSEKLTTREADSDATPPFDADGLSGVKTVVESGHKRVDSHERSSLLSKLETKSNSSSTIVTRPSPPTNIFGMRISSALRAMRGSTHSTSFYSQFYHLSIRTIKNFLRSFMLLPLHISTAIIMATFIGLCFWQQPLTIPVGLQNRMGAMFFTCALLGLTCMTSLELFISERAIFIAERANQYYGSWPYYFSKVLFDLIPLRVIPPIIFGSITYFMIGLRYDGNISYFLDYLLILVLFNVTCGGITLTIATVTPNVAFANMITLLLLFYFMLFGGFLLNNENIPKYLSWMRFTSPFQYALEAMMSNELINRPVYIDLKIGVKRLVPGQVVLREFGLYFSHFTLDLSMLVGMSVIFTLIPGVLLYFVREKR